jgi:PAS domain S-box-containing protein
MDSSRERRVGKRTAELQKVNEQRRHAEAAAGTRLRFEQLVSNISARFVNLPPDRLDEEIERALKLILEFFQVDRCGLLRLVPSGGVWMITHFAYSEQVSPVPTGVQLPAALNPWAYEKLVAKREVVIFSRIDDVPPEADVDKKTWAEWGIRSNLVIPILTGRPVTHVIAINSVKSERIWPEDFIPRLQLLGEIFVNSLERRRMQLQLEHALKFEEMLSVLSAKFVNLPSARMDAEIENGLQHIARFLDLDRCVLARLSDDKSQTITTHSWVASGVKPVSGVVENEMVPWIIAKIMCSETAIISDVDELPEDAATDRKFFSQVGIRSALYLPLRVSGQILGVLGFARLHAQKPWPEELVRGLHVAADVFSNALARQEKDRALQAAEKEYRTIIDFTYDWEYWENIDGSIRYASPSCERITGYSPREFVEDPQKLKRIIAAEDVAAWDEHFQDSRRSPRYYEIKFRIRCKDGNQRWIEHACRPVTDSTGNLLGIRASNRDITKRMQAEAAIHEREKELQSLTGRLILGQEEERRRLARELHDDLSQRLAVLAIEAGKAETAVQDRQDPVLKSLRELRDQAIQIAGDVHDISRRLHPSILDDLGVVKAVESECKRFSKREGVEVAFRAQNIPQRLPKDVSLAVYRIVQEGIANIAKHACARHVAVSLSAGESVLHLCVKDDGLGFDPAQVRQKPGLGLSSIRERARLLQGQHRIAAEPEKGTTITVTIPLKPEPPQKPSAPAPPNFTTTE